MSRRAWVRLDNASNIFLAARNDDDSKVFRIGAELDETVDPDLLQRALDATFDRYPLYHAVLRRGVFWYYLQDSDLRPRVEAEELPTCAPLYQFDRRSLLFRVVHHRRRVSLEVFHALSDGTGALWFLTDLLEAYCLLRHSRSPTAVDGGARDADLDAEPTRGLTGDSFAHYFRRRHEPGPADAAFRTAAAPAPLVVEAADGATSRAPARPSVGLRPRRGRPGRVHRLTGTRTPDDRPRAVDLTVRTDEILALARAEGVSLTMFLTALFFESVRLSSSRPEQDGVLVASIPVNLRQFFPSTSPRNFFATVLVEHRYGAGDDGLGAVCRDLESQFRAGASPDALQDMLARRVRFERTLVLRVVPRPIKDVILKGINWYSNRGLSVALSNLGRVSLPRRRRRTSAGCCSRSRQHGRSSPRSRTTGG